MKHVARLFLIVACFFMLTAQHSETLDVSIVNVDVFVTDKEGNRVRGLTANDFEVFENGVRQPISNFAEYSSAAQTASVTADTPAAGAVTAPPPEPRTIVVFFERMHLPSFRSEPFASGIKRLVRGTIREGDSLSLVLWSASGSAQYDVGDDIGAFEQALDRFAQSLYGAQFDEIGQAQKQSQDAAEFERQIAVSAAERGIALPATRLSVEAESGVVAEDFMLRSFLQMKRRVAAINATINSIAGLEGKKILLLATHRLGEVAGAEAVLAAGMPPSFETRGKYGTATMIKSVVDNANAGDVTIYPLYPPGLGNTMPSAETHQRSGIHPAYDHLVLMNETVTMSHIAKTTGGLMAYGTDVVTVLPSIGEDISDYYSLAYRISGNLKDRPRDIQVRAKNGAWVVRSRRQFVEKSEERRMRDRVIAALFRTGNDATLPIEATLGDVPDRAKRRETVPVTVRIPINALTILPRDGEYTGAFSVYVVSGGRIEEVSSVTQKTQPFEIAARDLAKAQTGHFAYSLDVVVNRRSERIAVAVVDEVGKTYGVVRLELEPAKQQARLDTN